jgi:hypothetical protein
LAGIPTTALSPTKLFAEGSKQGQTGPRDTGNPRKAGIVAAPNQGEESHEIR